MIRYHVHETATLESPALVGMAGHLHISGKGVALGYIGDPDLTEERFYDSKLAGGRSYKTGDLVRMMPENPWGDLCGAEKNLVLEFLGRADFQVKVRGHRIELQEIEEAARQAGMVEAITVLVKEENLVAFVTPEMVDVTKLRQALGENLPKYMVPHIILAQAKLPLTTSGKVDRKALEESLDLRSQASRRIRKAQNQLEQMVLNAYQTVLSREELSIDDDFFE